ncbi:hypothetical protein [Apibacter adventoris]|nr:hypothetical protein [Apibacter adventoris]
MQYYYHADHLGSSSYITNLDAQILVIDLNMKIEVKLSDKTSPVIQ